MEAVEVVDGLPPNIEKILEEIPAVEKYLGRGVVFAWDGVIYAPGRLAVDPWIVEHEMVHFEQQDGDPIAWWDRYLVDPRFRLDQEIEAHAAEYAAYCRLVRDRNQRHYHLLGMGQRLAGELYGRLAPCREIMQRIKKGGP